MPPLKNPNHEKLARAYAKEALQNGGKVVKTRVYQKVYKEASYDSARSTASQALARPLIKERIQEIIARHNPADDVARDLADLRHARKEVFDPKGAIVEVVDNPTRLGAVQTCLKVAEAFQSDRGALQDNRTVNFNILGAIGNAQDQGIGNDQGPNNPSFEQKRGLFDVLSQTVDKLAALTASLHDPA